MLSSKACSTAAAPAFVAEQAQLLKKRALSHHRGDATQVEGALRDGSHGWHALNSGKGTRQSTLAAVLVEFRTRR
jgi:hypothetical protein